MIIESGLAGRRHVDGPGQSGDRHGENPMEGGRAAQPSHEPEPIEARHLEIAENDVGLDFGDQVTGLFPVTGGASDHLEGLDQPNHPSR
jgi:hypothetical protein